jgi:hypothetical protein
LKRLNDEIKKKRPHLKQKKVLLHQDYALCHKSIKTKAKLHELGYELLPHPMTFFCLQTSKECLLERVLGISTNEEVITETEAYDHYNRCIALEGIYIE